MNHTEPQQTYRLQLCVFDSQRDYPEGEEAQRILAYYPADCTKDEQTAVVGLAEALATFSTNFDEDDVCTGMIAERSRWAFYRPEQQITFIMVAEQQWLSVNARETEMQNLLQQIHWQCVLLHGPMRSLLDSDRDQAKARLQTALNGTAQSLLRAKSSSLKALHSPLGAVHGVPWMPLEGASFTATHSLASHLSLMSLGPGQTVQGVMLLHEQYCLWSSLQQQDTSAVYHLVSTALLPAAKRPSIGKRLAGATGALRSRHAEPLPPALSVQSHKAWLRHQNGFLGLAPVDADTESELAIPTVHLQGGEEQAGLVCWCQGSMLLLMLISHKGPISQPAQQSILQVAQAPLHRLDHSLRSQLSSSNNFHIPGFRYLYIDHMLAAVHSSPQSKVNTLASDSLTLMASARLDLHNMKNQQAEREVIARGSHDCWVVAKHKNGRELFVVLEAQGEIGLLGASKLAAQMCDEHLPRLGLCVDF